MNDQKLKHKLYVIIFESDTPSGKLFDVVLIGCILASVLLVIIESLKGLPSYLTTPFVVMEYLFTAFFTFEYLTRIYCSPRPKKYIFSFFGIVDLLATLPLYIGLIFPGARYLLIIRAFRLIRVFRVFKLFNFLNEGERLLTALRESSKKIAVFFLFVVILVTSIGTLMYMIEGTLPNSQFNNIPNIIAVPTGSVSASMMKDYKRRRDKECPNCHRSGHEDNAQFCKYCGHDLNPTSKNEDKENVQ